MTDRAKRGATKKDSQLVIRLNSEQKDKFVSLCDDLDSSAAREIRLFIKQFMKNHGSKNS